VGTVATGFFLIAYLSVDQIFAFTGGLLILLSVGYFAFFQRRWWALAFLVLPVVLYQPQQAVSRVMEDGTAVNLIHSEENYYGSLKVVDYSFGDIRHREMIIDGMVQGGMDLNSRQSTYEYPYFLQYLSRALVPQGERCLMIGLGLGVVPNWLERQGVRCDVVDINPSVVAVAREYFDFHISGDMVIEDARYFLNATEQRYDYIVLDVFSGDITPAHLLSVEALTLMRERLQPGGVLAVNLIGSIKHETYMTASVVKTLAVAFDQVAVYPAFDPRESAQGVGNLVIMAYQGAERRLQLDRSTINGHHSLLPLLRTQMGQRFNFPTDTPAMVLTDAYNPIDFFDGWLRESVRGSILESTDWDILIN